MSESINYNNNQIKKNLTIVLNCHCFISVTDKVYSLVMCG